ncbi:hypothetical protein D5018_03440 [Parashewanella curva]|uniref:Uncharacterized protein n=1 Tax=Parashewanella curva TaxID=2338552 RepID=A0A3L8Q0L2_9GAMM|nr:hypothetical protein [Parashewanella curva]RLV61161.1 hypothetical protein D5018_03440 [Parashewanella curva]
MIKNFDASSEFELFEQAVALLVNHSVDLNVADAQGYAPMELALRNKTMDINFLNVLMKYGATFTCTISTESLIRWIKTGIPDRIEFLLEHCIGEEKVDLSRLLEVAIEEKIIRLLII